MRDVDTLECGDFEMKKLFSLAMALALAIVIGCSKSEPAKKPGTTGGETKAPPAAGDTAKPGK